MRAPVKTILARETDLIKKSVDQRFVFYFDLLISGIIVWFFVDYFCSIIGLEEFHESPQGFFVDIGLRLVFVVLIVGAYSYLRSQPAAHFASGGVAFFCVTLFAVSANAAPDALASLYGMMSLTVIFLFIYGVKRLLSPLVLAVAIRTPAVASQAIFCFIAAFIIFYGSSMVLVLKGYVSIPHAVNYGRSYSAIYMLLLILFYAARLMNGAASGQVPWLDRYQRLVRLLIPAIFGMTLLICWEFTVRAFAIPQVLLPAPSQIGAALVAHLPTLMADWRQTVLKGMLAGYGLGCGIGFLLALAVQQSRFLQRGLLPLGSVISAIPIVGIAPIMVMWFGFDWQSKAAVVVVMTVFPMLVSTLAGFSAVDAMHRDLMTSYAATPAQGFRRLVLPGALPHMFNALKLNSTLALIGAIVAEFFGTPIVGMGFRISTEVARMNVDVVWATILVAALTGSAAYGALALLEKALTFWHPSQRGGR